MIVVSTKKELKQAIKKHEPEIVVIGDLAYCDNRDCRNHNNNSC